MSTWSKKTSNRYVNVEICRKCRFLYISRLIIIQEGSCCPNLLLGHPHFHCLQLLAITEVFCWSWALIFFISPPHKKHTYRRNISVHLLPHGGRRGCVCLPWCQDVGGTLQRADWAHLCIAAGDRRRELIPWFAGAWANRDTSTQTEVSFWECLLRNSIQYTHT